MCRHLLFIFISHFFLFFLKLSSFFTFMLDNFTQLNGNGPGQNMFFSHHPFSCFHPCPSPGLTNPILKIQLFFFLALQRIPVTYSVRLRYTEVYDVIILNSKNSQLIFNILISNNFTLQTVNQGIEESNNKSRLFKSDTMTTRF